MAELERRVLIYANSLKSRADISPEKFGAAIGVALHHNAEEDTIRNARRLAVKEGYNYAISYFPDDAPGDFPMHSVRFYRQGKPPVTESPDGVCFWEADSAGRALQQIGYARRGELPFQRGSMRVYARSISEGKQEVNANLLTYPLAESKGAETCVYAITFRGGDV